MLILKVLRFFYFIKYYYLILIDLWFIEFFKELYWFIFFKLFFIGSFFEISNVFEREVMRDLVGISMV